MIFFNIDVCKQKLTKIFIGRERNDMNEYANRVNYDQNLSPLILLASWMSLVMMVTLLAWMAQRLVSSKRETR